MMAAVVLQETNVRRPHFWYQVVTDGGLSAGERCCQESLRPSVLFLFVVMAAEPASLMYATTNLLGFVWRPLTGEEEQVNRVRLS